MESSHSKLQSLSLYPSGTHATKVARELFKTTGEKTRLIFYLGGEETRFRNDTDRELPFRLASQTSSYPSSDLTDITILSNLPFICYQYRQESNFIYLTGCDIPGSRLLGICEKQSDPPEAKEDLRIKLILFIPDLDELDVMWSGMPLTPEEVAKGLDVTEVHYMREFEAKFSELQAKTVHVLPSHSLPDSSATKEVDTVDGHLLMACQEARLRKSPAEIDLIQMANDISSRAHEGVMKALSAGDTHSEYEASAVFNYYCAKAGAKALAYEVIAASGTSAGTLHYIKNKKSFPSSGEGSLLLLDAGCEHQSYGADITRTFPVGNGGKFTEEAKNVYRLVEEMQDAAFMQLKPGCSFEHLQILMHKVAAAGLLKLGILKKPDPDPEVKSTDYAEQERDRAQEARDDKRLVEEILASGLTTAFFPHGLGHSLGLDVHDSPLASRPNGPSKDILAKYLRFTRDLEEGNVVTVEPGIYFNPFLLKPFAKSPYLDQEVLKRYMPVGGVRIEDE